MTQFLNLIMQGNAADLLKRYADIALAVVVVAVVALLIVPVPTWLVDLLICANISFSLIMLLISLYITEVLSLSVFPTILLVATLFRLGLNVATARLILLNADAGDVIQSFGNFVVSGNFIVGIVIFVLLMLINMLVIAKGSERVAEVAARFTLDAMPGKQMSIDADLRAGALDLDQARKKRLDLGRESQLFGAMDGAMKFVKGDVIAGIIIFAINIIAGIIIGVTQKDMDIEVAVSTYAILSVGEGLVSIIPALLMSLCAGLIVTRVASGDQDANLGKDVASQILAQPKAFAIAAGFIVMIGQIPGLPRLPFTIIGMCVGAIAYALYRSQMSLLAGTKDVSQLVQARQAKVEKDKNSALQNAQAQEGSSSRMLPVMTPIALEVAPDLVALVDNESNFLGELIPLMRDGLFYELGIRYPGVRVRANARDLASGSYTIFVNEVALAHGSLNQQQVFVNDTPERLKLLGIHALPAKNPANGIACAWINQDQQQLAEQAGLNTWDAASYMVLHLSAVLRANAADFVGIQETQDMLKQLEQAYPALIKEVVPKAVSMYQLTDILRRLVREEITIRDLRAILQALAEWGPQLNDTIELTEHVRSSLKRYISHKYAGGQNTLIVYLLDAQVEEMIRSGIQQSSSSSYLALEPEITEAILKAVRSEIGSLPPSAQVPVILTTQDIRRYFRRLIEVEFPALAVIAYQELSSEMNVQPIARICIEK